MFQKRSLTTGFLVASLGIAAGVAVISTPDVASADGKKVECGKLKNAKLKSACDAGKGELAAVRKAMKDAVDKANAAGEKVDGKKLECTTCHTSANDFTLKSDGQKHFDEHLAKHL